MMYHCSAATPDGAIRPIKLFKNGTPAMLVETFEM
jgi:hypothetical protein